MINPCCVWDFTLVADYIPNYEALIKILETHCKKWTFQLEESESGLIHYQGRFSLKLKQRLMGVKKLFCKEIHLSPTSNENKSNMFYVSKEETRIDGPWSNTDEKIYIPRQVREITNLYPWQEYVVNNHDIWDTRTINIIIDKCGNIGKSTLTSHMRAHKMAFKIPFANDFKDILRMVADVPIKRCYIIDIPRAIQKDRLYQMFGAIEEIKNGYAYDDRYHFKEVIFDSPNIWVFTNIVPDTSLMSHDRWKLWVVNPITFELEIYDAML